MHTPASHEPSGNGPASKHPLPWHLLVGLALWSWSAAQSPGQAPPFEWVRSGGGSGADAANAVVSDATGSSFVTGGFQANATFAGITLTNPSTGPAMFLARYDAAGNVLWATAAASTAVSGGSCSGTSVALDSAGDCYVAGYFRYTVNFGGTNLAAGSFDAFLAKYRGTTGSLLWVRQAGNPSADEIQASTAVDSDGYSHLIGWFIGTATFGVTNITSSGAGEWDVFHARYDPAGNLAWVTKAGGLLSDGGDAVAADAQGNSYVTGVFEGTANFGGVLLTNQSGGQADLFIAKYDRSGSVVWAKAVGVRTEGIVDRSSISLDVSGNIFLAGDLHPYTNGFVSKFNPSGDLLWTRSPGTSVAAAASAASGDVYVMGSFKGNSNFGGTNLTSRGEDDLFIARYSSDGNLLWVKQAGFIYWDNSRGLALDAVGNVCLAGAFFDTSSFDGTNITGRGDYDAFVARLPASAPGALLVTSTNDAGPGSLRQALLDANALPGDNTIQILASGTIFLSAPLPQITGNTVIERLSTNATISGSNRVGLFTIAAGTTNTFRGLTLANGWLTNQNGAAISNGGTLTVLDCALVNHQIFGGDGGAIFNSGNLTLRSTLIAENRVWPGASLLNPSLGGGAYNSGILWIDTCLLSNNLAYGPGAAFESRQSGGKARGGAIYVAAGAMTLTNTSVVGNQVDGSYAAGSVNSAIPGLLGGTNEGGALFIESGQVTVNASTLASNQANGGGGGGGGSGNGECGGQGGKGGPANGGAVAMSGGGLTVLNSTLSGNVARGGSGGFRQFGGNGGDGFGGALFVRGGAANLTHVSIVDNLSGGGSSSSSILCGSPHSTGENGNAFGGGIYRTSGSVTIRNCLVSRNRVGGFTSGSPDGFGSFTSQGHNLVSDTNGSSGFVASDLLNIYDAKVDVSLLNNGGITPTYALQPESPAVDAAVPDPAITVDQRGITRPQGSAPDIGAYELALSFPAFVDNFAARRVIGGYTNYVAGTNSFYTKEPGEPSHADRKGAHSAWLSWIAPETGTCVMDTFGSSFDTVFAVYTGTTLSNLSLVAANDDASGTLQSQVSFVTEAGMAYQIAVDGYATNDVGIIVFHLDFSSRRPTILTPPQDQSVLAGSNANFSVVARGDPPLSYQWLFGGTPLANATNATLTIANAQPTNEGPYRVIVSNAMAAVTSTVATLTVLLPPSITVQPQNQVAIAGTSVTFSVGASGTAPLSYQWRRNGTPLAGATNELLVLPNTQPIHNGSYSVVVTNPWGAATSAAASLTVRYSLTILTNGNGAVTASPLQTDYAPNAVVILTAFPGPSHTFGFWSGDASGTSSPFALTMTSNRVVTANFLSAAVPLSVTVQGQGTVAKAPDKPLYDAGEQVTLSATPARWYGFTRWGDGPTVNPRLITIATNNNYTAIFSPTTALETLTLSNVTRTAPVGMPAILVDGELVVTGAVTRLDAAEVSILTTFTNGTVFFSLNGESPSGAGSLYTTPFTLRRSATVRAVAYDGSFLNSWEADPVQVLIEPTFPLIATTAGGGTVSISPMSAAYRSNTPVAIHATAVPGWSFLQWLGDVTGTSPSNTLVMARAKSVQAIFGTALGTTVTSNGAIVVDPVAALYPYGTGVRLTALPQSGNSFVAWGNAASSTNNPLLFTVTNANPTVSCLFVPLSAGQYALTVLAQGRGQVTTSPRGSRFNSGQSVILTAWPDPDQSFLGWSGDASGTQTNKTVVMSQSRTITARFSRCPRLTLAQGFAAVREEGLRFMLASDLGTCHAVERAEDLVHWTPLVTLTNLSGAVQFSDAEAIDRPHVFYRAVEAP